MSGWQLRETLCKSCLSEENEPTELAMAIAGNGYEASEGYKCTKWSSLIIYDSRDVEG